MKKIMLALVATVLSYVAGFGLGFAQSVTNNPWQGFYVGAGVGGIYDNNQIKAIINNVGNASYTGVFNAGYDIANVGPSVFGTNGVFGNNMVFGIWTEGVLAQGKTNVLNAFSLYNNGEWAIGGRLGFTIAPNFLIYGTGGYTLGAFESKGLVTSSALKRLNGYTVGGGVEWHMANNIFAKMEYRHNGFDNAGLDVAGKQILEDSITSNRVTLGIAYKFNGGNALIPLGNEYYRPLK